MSGFFQYFELLLQSSEQHITTVPWKLSNWMYCKWEMRRQILCSSVRIHYWFKINSKGPQGPIMTAHWKNTCVQQHQVNYWLSFTFYMLFSYFTSSYSTYNSYASISYSISPSYFFSSSYSTSTCSNFSSYTSTAFSDESLHVNFLIILVYIYIFLISSVNSTSSNYTISSNFTSILLLFPWKAR